MRAADRPGRRAGLGPAVLGAPTVAQGRRSGARGPDLVGAAAELSPHGDHRPPADPDPGGLIAIAVWWLYSWRTGAAPLGAQAPAATWGLGLLLAWFAVPVAITFVYSVAAHPLFQPRNLLMCVPAASLLLGAGLGHPRLPRLLAPALLVP